MKSLRIAIGSTAFAMMIGGCMLAIPGALVLLGAMRLAKFADGVGRVA